MRIATLSVKSVDNVIDNALQAFSGKVQGDHISFLNYELLWKVLAPNRLNIVKALIGSEPLALSEIARRVDRDVKAVDTDVQLLLNTGMLDKAESGKIVFRYDAIHVDFILQPD